MAGELPRAPAVGLGTMRSPPVSEPAGSTPSEQDGLSECFSDKRVVSVEVLRALQKKSNGPGVARLLAQSSGYVAAGVTLVLADQTWLVTVAFIVSAVFQFSFFGMLHEACHFTAFSSRRLNLFAGWVAALAQPMSPALMRAFHYEHHRFTHQLDRDPELAQMPFMVRWPPHLMWLITMTGLPIVAARFGWTLFAAVVPPSRVWDKVLPFVRPAQRRAIAWEARGLTLIHGGAIAAAVLWLPELWRVYAALVMGHAILSLYITCEHRGLATEGTIFERTRSLRTPAWLRWLLWNMPFHAEHHGWPAVPFHALPKLHATVREHLVHRVSPTYLHLHGGREPSP